MTEASKFKEDLGLDSLDAVEVVMAIEDEVHDGDMIFLCLYFRNSNSPLPPHAYFILSS